MRDQVTVAIMCFNRFQESNLLCDYLEMSLTTGRTKPKLYAKAMNVFFSSFLSAVFPDNIFRCLLQRVIANNS